MGKGKDWLEEVECGLDIGKDVGVVFSKNDEEEVLGDNYMGR